MADSFDPYHKWLGISLKDQPPHYYRLLALELFESDPDVIESAADQRMAHVRTFQTGQNSALSQRILNELSAARLCLLDPQKKADYDRHLREKTPTPADVQSGASPAGSSAVTPGALVPATSPRSLPQAKPLPVEPVPFVVPGGSGSKSAPHKRLSRKTPIWQQPAMVATAAAAALLAAVAIYAVSASNKPPVITKTGPAMRSSATAAKPSKRSGTTSTSVPKTVAATDRAFASAKPDFEIIEASWGVGDKWVNVTDAIRGLVRDNRLMMMVWSNHFGSPEDPAKGVEKKLRIQYRSRGQRLTVEYPDYYFVYLDGKALAPPTSSPDGLELLEARYGAGKSYVDVLPQLRLQPGKGRVSVPADQFAATTADELAKDDINSGTFKVLWIRYRNGTGEHFTYAWNADPVVIESKAPATAGMAVDLLARIDLKRDVVAGEWRRDGGVLRAPATQNARIQIPFDPPDEYMLTVVAEGDPEIKDIGAVLAVGGKQVRSTLDGFLGTVCGISLVNGKHAHSNPTHRWRCARMLEQGRPNTLVYIVRPNSVRVLRDGAELTRWSGDPATFAIDDQWKVPDPRRLSLQAYDTAYRISKLELVPLAPEKSPMLANLPPDKPVNVLKDIDLDRDLLHGNWQCDGKSLLSPDSDKGRIQLPAVVPSDYKLDVVARRESGNDCLTFTLPIGGAQATLLLDGSEGKLSGLQAIDDKNIDANETRYEGSIFSDGKPKPIAITVRKNHVQVTCDGKKIVDWTGDVSRLKPSDNFPYKDRVYVGDWYSRYRLSKIELTPLGSEAGETPPALASAPSADNRSVASAVAPGAKAGQPRKFADLALGKETLVPEPDDEAQRKARHDLQKKFAAQLAAAKSPDEKRTLSEDFINMAASGEEADLRLFALLRQAVALAEAAGDLDLAWQAIDQLGQSFVIDRLTMHQASLTEVGKAAKSAAQCRELADAACQLMAAALAAGQPAQVKKVAAQAQSFAKRAKDAALIKEIGLRTRDAGALAARHEAVAAARETLKATPDDEKANFIVGYDELCAAGDWTRSLPKLAKGSDADWKKLAADDLALVREHASPAGRLALADAWWARAEKEPWPGRHFLRMRSGEEYRRALPSLVSEDRARAIDRLKTLLALDEGLPNWELFDLQGGQLAGGHFKLRPRGELRTPVEYEGPIDVMFVARTASQNIRLYAHDNEAVIWNWELNPAELRVRRPDGAIRPAAVTPLKPHRWYTFHYEITRRGTSVSVDGIPVFTEEYDYGPFPRSPVGVNGAFGSLIEVKKLVVKPLE